MDEKRSRIEQTELVKRLYMQSKHFEWTPFAEEQGWHPQSTRVKYPVATWVADKKRDAALAASEDISSSIFTHRRFWHKEVLKTLKEYPETNEAIHTIIRQRVNDLLAMITADRENKKADPKAQAKFEKIVTKELRDLAQAAKLITEAKYKSLLLANWDVRLSQDYSDEMNADPETKAEADKGWVVEIKGNKKLCDEDFMRMVRDYYDPSKSKPALPALPDLNAEAQAQVEADDPLNELMKTLSAEESG